MEYIFTNLPQYIKITPQSAFSSSIVESGHALLFMPTSSSIMAKLSDGSFITVGGSGGTDVSDTTADAGDVLEGKVFHDSAGSLTSGTIPVVSGGSVIVPGTAEQLIVSSGGAFVNGSLAVAGDTALVASNIMSGITIFGVSGTAEAGSGGVDVSDTTAEAANVLSGKVFHDSQGAVTTGTIPTVSAAITSGAVVVPSGYIAEPQSFPVSGGSEEDVTLGYVSGGVFYELSFSGTSSTEAASSAGLSAYSWNLPPSSSGTVISSGGSIIAPVYISSGQIFDSMTVYGSNGTLSVLSGGIAYNTTLEHGNLYIHGGTAVNVSGVGYIHMNSGGRLSGAVLYASNGVPNLEINSGNVADYVTITSGTGYIYVYSSGALNHATLGCDAKLTIHSNGSASDIILSSGATMCYYSGARTADITSMTGAVISQIYNS